MNSSAVKLKAAGRKHDLSELVISRGRTGYLALSDYIEPLDTIPVLAPRNQREAGYADDIGPA